LFLRFLRLVVREGAEPAFQAFYRGRVIPALSETPGCLFAGLLTPWRSDEHRSLTLWRSAEDACAYEEGGLYQALLRESMPYLSSRTVWRQRASRTGSSESAETIPPRRDRDSAETLAPRAADLESMREIPPEGYLVTDEAIRERLAASTRPLFVRVVAVHVRREQRAEFDRQYVAQVRPAMVGAPGCVGAFLAESTRDPNQALSISVWDREESATRFEMTAEYERLRRMVRETLSPLAPWQLELGVPSGERAAGEGVASYRLVHGRALTSDPG
jgi:heme-degrading monooxygenase HmoA